MPRAFALGAGLAGGLIVLLAAWRREWEVPLHVTGVAFLGVVVWLVDERNWWLALLAVITISASFWVAIARGRRRAREAESKTDALASQLDRRISELFSLQELSYVLSESIQLDRIVDQVVRYAGRFLQTDGAIVVLADDDRGQRLRVVAATGTLEALQGCKADENDAGLVRFAISRERIEVAQGGDTAAVNLIGGLSVRSAAVAPLRSQGVTMGALAVADRQGGPFTTEDLWLLSTVATNASVVLANSRLYEIVRQSKEEWETAFNALTEGIAVVGPTGAVLRANRALASLAELSESELMGRGFCETLFGTSEAVEELIRAAYRRQRTAPLVVRLERSQRELRLTAAPFADQPGRPATADAGTVVILVEDVTEQRILEAQLIQNDKMASIGQLVSGVAHELNNPLTSIAGLTELLLERAPNPDFPHEHLRVIHDQAERAGRIVRNLLTFARKGVVEKTAVDLNDVAARTSLLIVYELQLHGIQLESELSSEPVIVLGDRYELQQVLLNLVNNAVHAVTQLEPGRPRRIRLETALQHGTAVVRVRDSGAGVPPHLVSYLFTPFFTTKAPGEGTGLGLSLSYGLVKAHGGILTYEPPPEGGAEFRINLPAYHAPDDGLLEQSRRAAAAAAHRILVVDDDPAVHRLVSALFTPQGHVVEAVRSGAQGLLMLKERDFDLIVADAMAAAGPTERFAQALAAQQPHTCARLVLGVSANGDLADAALNGVHLVRKPFSLRDLNALAQEIFASSPPRSPAATEGR
ncbi:MAG TPA: ATP-binding protein [Gemmatimonadales bacterium]|jgi:two-component system NtrC family sensor kinase